MDKKKVLLVIGFIGVVIVMAVLLYFAFFKRPPAPPPVVVPPEEVEVVRPARLPVTREIWERMTIEERITRGLSVYEFEEERAKEVTVPPTIERRVAPQIDEVAQGGRTWINPISSDPVQGATLAADGQNNVFYDKSTGQFYEIDSFGNKTLLTDQVFYNVSDVNWAPTKDRAIIEYPDGFKVMYDFDKDQQYTLPKNWEEFSWDSAGGRIAFKAMSKYPENTWLAVARPDGSGAKPIEHMGDNADKVTVSWSPNSTIIAFSATGTPRGTWEQELLLIGQHGENFKPLVVDGRGFESRWAPEGDKIAYSVYSADSLYQPRLYIAGASPDNIGENKIATGLATWAHKCAFNNGGSYLYCAVPQFLPEGAGLVAELSENTRDDFYKINTATGEVSFLAEGAMGGYNVRDMYVSGDDSVLYFVDENTERLRSIRLK
ncbi:hypothetical protein MYX07_00560 [Patescibacteria group bacterium AH-259-L07]|nr:hypothetical protein [Patescibacteria group bacterium AH-259-L07]